MSIENRKEEGNKILVIAATFFISFWPSFIIIGGIFNYLGLIFPFKLILGSSLATGFLVYNLYSKKYVKNKKI